ncbi:hypothetical protein DDZ13_08195 [Coraliomargarita sinensis]|uniref:Tyr recombinase domain-containing protein n=1 Tax=Coraliomargarita sinensis TaxID=2174842 RepID=A0A317ZF20_9BACT|nr:tyrosine-type recombinase/integrase [Coraliomargarita sinensis]PXA04016.1 hypothetical protein DDZ13_08195 [Coraliomargarita sinensis]
MSLELRKNSKRFYARLTVNGKRKAFPLNTHYRGKPPDGLRLKNEGDAEFERSRGEALAEEKALQKEFQEGKSERQLREKVYEAMTGNEFKPVDLKDLFKIAKNFPRTKPWSPKYAEQIENRCQLFLEFLNKRHVNISYAHEVTRNMVEGFLAFYLTKTNCSAKTLDDVRVGLQGLWTVLEKKELQNGNPFRGIPKKYHITTTKEIFTPKQIEQILHEAEKDPELYQITVTSISTGMRLGDCCTLKWASVNMKKRIIFVPAVGKTQKPVAIPFFGQLEEVLKNAEEARVDEEYVFPLVRRLYARESQYFSKSFSQLLLRIGFTDDENPETSIRLTGESGGSRRRPVRSFHGLKTTWMTMALRGGVSLEDIKKICGNVDTQVILKHYFQSDAERIRSELKTAMPEALSGVASTGSEPVSTIHLLNLLDQMSADNWEFISKRMREELLKTKGNDVDTSNNDVSTTQ